MTNTKLKVTRKQKIGLGLLIFGMVFFPGFLSIIFEDDSSKSSNGDARQWMWNFQDFQQSFLEVACSLPYSECEWRPYHRRFLSYMLMNLLCCLFCTAMFYPVYLKGYIMPLPSLTFTPIVRIGPFDLIR